MLTTAGLCALASGCPATTNPAVLPITAVDTDIQQLLDQANLGCGTGPNQVYKYAVVLKYAAPGEPVTANDCPFPSTDIAGGVYDCFAQGVFANLPLQDGGLLEGGVFPDGGSQNYSLWVYFYDYATYCEIEKDCEKGGDKGIPGPIEEAVRPGAEAGSATPICKLKPFANWTTTCSANEQDNIVVNAACEPISLGSGPSMSKDASRDVSKDREREAAMEGSAGDAVSTDAPPADASESGGEAAGEAAADAPGG